MAGHKTIVFDLDGTLVDSVRDLVPALNHATSLDGLPPIEIKDVGHVVGKGAMKMIELAFAFHNQPLSSARHHELFDVFLERYEAHTSDETVFYDGVLGALKTLRSNGWRFAVCTNKHQGLAEKLLKEMAADHHFDVVTGGNTFEFKKPDPRHILETITMMGGDPENSIMVGDSINDIEAGQKAGLPTIAVDFGYTDIPVTEMNPSVIISHFDQLVAAIAKVSAK